MLLDSRQTLKLIRHYGPRQDKFHTAKSEHSVLTHQLLEDLGFVAQPRLYPQSYHDDRWGLPVFVTAVAASDLPIFPGFLYSMAKYFPDKKLVVYNLDLNNDQKNTVSLSLN